MKIFFKYACWLISIYAVTALASIDTDLSNYFNKLGYQNDVTLNNAYKGQSAGYYTGGSIYARDATRNLQIAEVDLPNFRSGCGGIDLFNGGFSFINSKDLLQELENISNNAKGYAFLLAMESATPEIANAMKYMNTLANDVNRMNISSCETAAGLVGSVWPKTHEAQQQVCQDIGANNGLFKDYASARQACSTGGQLSATLNNATGPYQNLVFNNSNVAWRALMTNSFLQSDTQLAELFMSLSGTIIMNNTGMDDSSQHQYKVLPSLAGNQSLIKALLYGGPVQIYHCDDVSSNGCLNPTLQSIAINENYALMNQVKSLLTDMVNKIYSDQALTDQEIGFLNATRLPIYKMLNVQAAFAGGNSVINITDYADVIAIDILFQYLAESISVVKGSAASLQLPDAILTEFSKGVDQARDDVHKMGGSAYAQISATAQLISQTQTIEQMLAGSLSTELNNNLQWANKLRQ